MALARHLNVLRKGRCESVIDSLPRRCFPRHEIIERSSCFSRNTFDDMRIVDQTEKEGLIWNQIEWVYHILQGCNNPHKCVIGNFTVFAPMVGANQTQHGLEISPVFLKRLPRDPRCLSRCNVNKRL